MTVSGAEVVLKGLKDKALLAFLALEPGVDHRRERLAGLLWGAAGEAQARDSLKHALARLRKTLGPDLVSADRDTVRAEPKAFHLDAADFAESAGSENRASLDRALNLWRGEFLSGLVVGEPGFDDWQRTEAARLRQLADYAAARLLAMSAESDPPAEAIATARRALRLDPQNERACRLLMRGLSESGDRAQAMAAYHDFAKHLSAALDIVPEPETTALFRAIRAPRRPTQVAEPQDDLPSRPSVAVLPFRTLRGEDTWFAEGVAEEIITVLSRFRGMDLISRSSSFAMAATPDMAATGRALGARYLVQGSTLRDAEKVRINVSLTEAETGTVLWSEGFQEALIDIFELHGRIAARVAGTLLPRLEAAEIARSSRKPTESLDAYDHYLRGLAEMHRWSEEPCARALEHFARATDLDPDFALAHVMKVRCYSQRKASRWVRGPEAGAAEVAESLRLSRLAAALAPDDALVLSVAGLGVGYIAGQPEQGVRMTERALALNPSLTWAWTFSGWMHVWLGLSETAIEHFERAMRLSPQDPQFMMMQTGTAWGLFTAGRAREAADWAERAVMGNPNVLIAWCALAAGRAGSGDRDGARAAMAEILRIDSGLSAANFSQAFPIRDAAMDRRWSDALAIAGLPA